MVAIAQSVEHLIVVQEVARSSRVSHPTLNPYSQQGSRGFTVSGKNTIQTVLVCQLCAISGKKLATDFVLALQVPNLALPGPVPDGDDIPLHLPVQSGQAFAFLSGQSRLVFLVDALVEVLVQEDRESFSPVGRSGDVVGVVSGIRETSSGG